MTCLVNPASGEVYRFGCVERDPRLRECTRAEDEWPTADEMPPLCAIR